MKCANCEHYFWSNELIFHNKYGYHCYICQNCAEKEINMPNIKITAEVDGKQVPLETVSTETFEAIKALEKPKEIPVARLAIFADRPRLLFKPLQNVSLKVEYVYSLDLKNGCIGAGWSLKEDDDWIIQYRDVKPL